MGQGVNYEARIEFGQWRPYQAHSVWFLSKVNAQLTKPQTE